MRYYVTGGCGFIGSNLCKVLLAKGHSVACTDNLITGRFKNIKDLLFNPKFSFTLCDASKIPMDRYDGIFHLASPAAPGDISRFTKETVEVNNKATRHLLDYCNKYEAKLLFVSTMKVYGDCERVDAYIKGKREGEGICGSPNGIQTKIARLASVFGPNMRPDDSRVIPVFITKALKGEPVSLWNGGSQIDSFCYVTDIVKALIDFMESDHTGVIEFGNPNGISIANLAKGILSLTKSKSEIQTNEKIMVVDECHRIPNLERAFLDLKWVPEINLEAGLVETIAYFKEELRDE